MCPSKQHVRHVELQMDDGSTTKVGNIQGSCSALLSTVTFHPCVIANFIRAEQKQRFYLSNCDINNAGKGVALMQASV